MKAKGSQCIFSVLCVALLLAACSGDDEVVTSTADTFDITILGVTTSMTETAGGPAGSDPFIFIAKNTGTGFIELIAAQGITSPAPGNAISSQLIVINLPINTTTTGTFTELDGAGVFYAENFDDSDSSVTLAYGSATASITVTSVGGVGSRWAGTFTANTVDIFPGGGPASTATGSFSTIREVDEFNN